MDDRRASSRRSCSSTRRDADRRRSRPPCWRRTTTGRSSASTATRGSTAGASPSALPGSPRRSASSRRSSWARTRGRSSRSSGSSTSRPRTSRAGAPSTTRSPGSSPRSGTSRRARSRSRCGSSSAAASASGCGSMPTATPARRSRATARRSCLGACTGWSRPRRPSPELHWAPPRRSDVYTPEAYAARAREMADRGFTALKFDLDLPLLPPTRTLYARTISAAQLERQVELAEATVKAVAGRAEVAFDLHWRYAPADALRLARALEHSAASSGSRIRRRHRTWRRSPASPPARPRRSAPARTSIASTASRHSSTAVASTSSRRTSRRSAGSRRHAADRRVRGRALAPARAAQHRGPDRHVGVGPRVRLDPELPRPRVARGVGAVLRRARHARRSR